MNILISGGTGFVGRPLTKHLSASGHHCHVLTRRPDKAPRKDFPSTVTWGSYNDPIAPADIVINLAGESIAGLWTSSKKTAILKSRVETTQRVVALMQAMRTPPRLFISVSGIGYYGNRPHEKLTEESPPDTRSNFRAQVCLEWEKAAQGAAAAGIRTVILRFSHILHPSGGYLGKLIPLYCLGLCFSMQQPETHSSWVSLRDVLRLIEWLTQTPTIQGPVNVATPTSTLGKDFTRALARAMNRIPLGSLPSWMMKATLGDFADALMEDQYMYPEKALQSGFRFQDTDLERTLKGMLNG